MGKSNWIIANRELQHTVDRQARSPGIRLFEELRMKRLCIFVVIFVVLLSTIFFLTSRVVTGSQDPAQSSWLINAKMNFTEYDYKVNKAFVSYHILIEKVALNAPAETKPSALFLSSFHSYHDLGLGFEDGILQSGDRYYYCVLDSVQSDVTNLTSSGLYPFDHYTVGFIIVLNETANIRGSDFLPDLSYSREITDVWKPVTEFHSLELNDDISPLSDLSSNEIRSALSAWPNSSAFLFKVTFQRLETTSIVLSFWLPALIVLFATLVILFLYFHVRRAGGTLIAVLLGLTALCAGLLGVFFGVDRPSGTLLETLLEADIIIGILALIPIAIFTAKQDTIAESEHMTNLSQKAIVPWIKFLKTQPMETITVGKIEIEISKLIGLFLNSDFHTETQKEPEFDYSKEFAEHLRTGYSKQFRIWTHLKEEWITFMNYLKAKLEALQEDLIERVGEETKLDDRRMHSDPDSPTDYFFDSSRLTYLIYLKLLTQIKSDKDDMLELPKIIQGSINESWHVSKSPFSHLAQGKEEQCKALVEIVRRFLVDPKQKRWVNRCINKRKKLDDEMARFTVFLEGLAKTIENKKKIRGRCTLC
jgi:hypothetical protein